MSEYRAALSALYRLESFGMRLGLENVAAYCAEAGHPERAWPAFHVAGTNGKGTTAACLDALARGHGLRAGLYTSPHLVDFRERIRVDGRAIPEAELVSAWRRVGPFAESRALTFFEAGTLIAFEWFARSRVDLGIVEVGLGGRLDATNLVASEISLVTNVALDHERHLGPDLAAIAREKAGIARAGVPLLVGDVRDSAARAAIAAVADERGAPVGWLDEEAHWRVREMTARSTTFDYESSLGRIEGLSLPLAGEVFIADAALAMRAWERSRGPLDPTIARAAVACTAPAGRMEWGSVAGAPVLLDVAHNPAALERLVAAAGAIGRGRWTFVAGILTDKRWEEMVDALLGLSPRGRLCGLGSASPNRRLTEDAAAAALSRRPGVAWAASVAEGIEGARGDVLAGVADTVLVTGSFHTVGEALVALGMAKPDRPYLRAGPRAALVASGEGA